MAPFSVTKSPLRMPNIAALLSWQYICSQMQISYGKRHDLRCEKRECALIYLGPFILETIVTSASYSTLRFRFQNLARQIKLQ